jgi:pSer/pThr/pTyr-binding forkhead associated (FHA) protein
MAIKSMNSQLNIKTIIWKNEIYDLLDYYSNETIKNRIKVDSSGVLSRVNEQIIYTPGENLEKSPSNLLSVKKDEAIGKYLIDCGTLPKNLDQLAEENGAFFVYRGISSNNKNNNKTSENYYKLSQGDIIKIGRIYFKVLDINIKKDDNDMKNSIDSTLKGTMLRYSSCNSLLVINGQKIIKGASSISPYKKKDACLYHRENAQINLKNKSKFFFEKLNKDEETLAYKVKSGKFLPKIASSKLPLLLSKKSNTKSKKIKKIKKIKKKDINPNTKNKSMCRVCYGDDSTDENPLISPCKCKGSMKYIHYKCLKNWLNSKIEEDISVDSDNPENEAISYKRKDISCELCKEKLPDYIKYNGRYYNITFYKPKFEEYLVLESMRADGHKTKFIHIISFDKKNFINIGRAYECELSISEISVSRFHCIIHKDKGDLFLEDNISKFGTLILIQNNNMVMNDYLPLKVQINKTYIELKITIPLSLTCCKNPLTFDSRKYDYQMQNQKKFDFISYFFLKENGSNQIDNENENENIKELIDNNSDKNSDVGISINKDFVNDLIKKENKDENSDCNSHTNRIKKINIKKSKNDNYELPQLEKINLEHIVGDLKRPPNLNNLQQNKQISLIRLNNKDGSYDKTNVNPNSLGSFYSSIIVNNHSNHKNK